MYFINQTFCPHQSWFLEAPFVRMLRMRSASLKTFAEQIDKMTATVTQNDNFVHLGQFLVSSCEFA